MTAGRMRLAVDIGGTFTDGVLIEDGTDRTWTHKVLTTPDDPSAGFIEVVDELIRNAGCRPRDLVSVTHATTLTTNILLQRRGARTALLVTAGFEDILEIGRQIRHELYDLQTNKPIPLVQRSWCYPVVERLDHTGRDPDAARRRDGHRRRRPGGRRRHRIPRDLLPPRVRQRGPRAASRGDRSRAPARRPRVGVERDRAADQGVLAGQHDRGERLRRAGDGSLPLGPRGKAP